MRIVSEKRSANAVGGKTARACDSCLRRRARWYCAADDAFLCQGCDTSVHSANPLARRHERVRLKTASSSSSSSSSPPSTSFKPSSAAPAAADSAAPSWHQGFKRKARTPRAHHTAKLAAQHAAAAPAAAKLEPLVPDFEATSLDENAEEEEEQLLYRVPIFDPVLAEFCSGHVSDESTATTSSAAGPATAGEAKPAVELPKYVSSPVAFASTLPGFSPSDVDIGDFAADVESLLGRGLDEDAFCMEGLGLMDAGGDVSDCCLGGGGHIKLETDSDDHKGISDLVAARMATTGDTLDLNFDCGSPTTGGHPDEGETKPAPASAAAETDRCREAAVPGGGLAKRRRITLRLDYGAVIDAWSSAQGCTSPWADGERPQLNPDDCWPDYMGMWVEASGVVYGGGSGTGGEGGVGGGDGGGSSGGAHGAAGDGGREARVSRYREKRRTRLFSKKIRYEVRKLNAEKRPRMKGRFVKSASFVGGATAIGGGAGMGVAVGVAPPPSFAF